MLFLAEYDMNKELQTVIHLQNGRINILVKCFTFMQEERWLQRSGTGFTLKRDSPAAAG